ncbi:Exoenzyme S synthesis regulatory protein ExsA [termite gut metagenome]|uniref:Exoenzyme S synthesis regulatory protein ExsA n=1 Tax=termite gut metagenome TaxID=433724 RepID=A0A5J4RS95_9ZZZZ
MEKIETNHTALAGIFFACTEKKQKISEHIVPEHILTHIYTGKISVTTADKTYSFSAGQTALFARNQLAKFVKEPDGETACKSVSIFFTQPFLQQFYALNPLPNGKTKNFKIVELRPHPLLNDLFQSIETYSALNNNLMTDNLTQLKLQEALTIVRQLNKDADILLSDFSEPHKIDLADFMQKNFMFNIPNSRFAYLTGRSLAAFKRDFQKIFNTSSQKWLTEKRLELAHFLIVEKHVKPSQAYIDAGFKNFSHFTHAFKQFFGYNPSAVFEPLNK